MHLLDLLQRRKPAAAPLASLLADLNIEPFDAASVEQYKKEKKEKTFRAILPKNSGQDWRQHHVTYTYSPSIADPEGILALRTLDEIPFLREAQANGWDLRFYQESLGRAVPIAVWLRWHRMSIADAVVAGGVPDYVAHKANQILEKAPAAVLEVDALQSKTQSYDPFLVVTLGSEQYYVEVWGDDDKEFQR